jgi:hypothetical protein
MVYRALFVPTIAGLALVFSGCEMASSDKDSARATTSVTPTPEERFAKDRVRLMQEMAEAQKSQTVFLSTVAEVDGYLTVADDEFLRARKTYRSMVDKETAKSRNQMKGSDRPTYQDRAVKWPSIGMSIDHADKVSDFGTIVGRNTSKTANVERVQIVYDYYGSRRYLYFVNEQLESMQY